MNPTPLLDLPAAEPPPAFWRDKASYDAVLRSGLVEPLEAAVDQHGTVPSPLQRAAVQRLAWYFAVDLRERAPTVVVDEPLAVVFHALVGRAMRCIDPALLRTLEGPCGAPAVRHALWSYLAPELHTEPAADAYDHDQGLVRVSYWVHGAPPAEQWQADSQPIQPAFAKDRACNFFRRRLLRQRIAWLPAAGRRAIQVQVGIASAVAIDLDGARARFLPGKAALQRPLPSGWAGWKVRLMKALAALPPVRWHYRNAWVFIDRYVEADDSAEHLYRWVRQQHPQVKTWYLLHPDSTDWPRLKAESFRLLGEGLRWRLLALNCQHVISSHTGKEFGLDAAFYGDRMRWRYSFLQHGVIKDDISHWLGPPNFDLFLTSSPAEHASIVADDTPYPYTDREVRRTGLPRHDRLLRLARALPRAKLRRLLVMPTWRGSLVDERMTASSPAERLAAFARSEYATRWRSLLSNPQLHAHARAAGLQLTFVPHTNAEPFVAAFDLPPEVEVMLLSSGAAQQFFAQTAAYITDYSSAAFEFALLRRQVFYYQFDQKDFYNGGHNWRPGYFDYERDGFGPVLLDETALVAALKLFFDRGTAVDPLYLARMQRAMPDDDGQACQRAFDAISSLRQPGRLTQEAR